MRIAMTRVRSVALLLLGPAVGMTIGAHSASTSLTALNQEPLLEGPDSWIALQADVSITKPDRARVLGRFYRSSDGSRRLDTGPGLDDIQATYIMNVAEAQEYVYSKATGWIVRSVPSMVGRDYRPRQTRPIRPDVSDYPYALALKRGEDNSLHASTGFRAYQTNGPDGAFTLTIPELNHFVVLLNSGNGRSEAYSNIELHEPPAALFQPPERVIVSRQPPRSQPQH